MQNFIKSFIWLPLITLVFILTSCGGSSSGTLLSPSPSPSPSVSSLAGSVSPANGTTDISKATNFTIVFKNAVNPTSLSGSGVAQLVSSSSDFVSSQSKMKTKATIAAIPLTLQVVSSDNKTAVFNLPAGTVLASNTQYQIQIDASLVQTASNQALGSGLINVGMFTTGTISTPVATMFDPVNGSTNQSTSLIVQIAFSEDVNNVNTNTVSISGGGAVNSIAAGTNNVYSATVTGLNTGTTYTLSLTSGITNNSGVALAPTSFTFATGSNAVPSVVLNTPANGTTGVILSPSIQIQFSEAVFDVTPGTTTAGTVNLYANSCSSGTLVSLNSLTLNSATNTYTTSPSSNLTANTTYCLAVTNGITDADGNAVVPVTFTFTTGDHIAPSVGIIHPTNNSANASFLPSIQVQFSEAVLNVTANTTTSLYAGTNGGCSTLGSQVTVGTITSGSNFTYTFSPTTALNPSSPYCVVLTNGITDVDGNALAPTKFLFTTGTTGSPSSSLTTPTNNATGVSLTTNAVVTFSTAVSGVDTTTFTVHSGSPTGALVAGTVVGSSGNTVFTFTPTNPPLLTSTTYYIVLTSGITDSNGDALVATTYQFTTGAYYWTWMGGSSSSNAFGVYGTLGTGSNSNIAGARVKATYSLDSSGNMWIFGGNGYGVSGTVNNLNDFWKFTPNAVASSGTWTWMGGSNGAAALTAGTYGTKGTAATTNLPGSRFYAGSWRDASGNMWLYGGRGQANTTGGNDYLPDLWKYTPNTGSSTATWTWMGGASVVATTASNGVFGTLGTASTANTPTARRKPITWIDASGNLWLFGGGGNDSAGNQGVLNDLWKYTPNAGFATATWTWMGGSSIGSANGVYGTLGTASTANIPGAREDSPSWIDSSGNVWIFGGAGNGSAGGGFNSYLNDLWKYTPNTGASTATWTWMGGASLSSSTLVSGVYGTLGVPSTANIPGPRVAAANWIDSSGNLWLFGGLASDNSSVYNDLWKYTPSTGTWTWVSGASTVGAASVYGTLGVASSANVPGARQASVGWIDSSGNMWIIGGLADNTNTNFLNAIWELTFH